MNENSANAKKRVLFLSMTAGQGHNSASKAVADYLKSQGQESFILDTYTFLNTVVGKTYDKGYQLYAKHHPAGLEKISETCERIKGTSQMKRYFPFVFADLMKKKLSKYIERFDPCAIVCPHQLTSVMITQLRKDGLIDPNIPCIGIVTDYTLHAFWEYTDMDYFVVGADFMVQDFVNRGIRREQVLPFGIPIREVFNERTDQREAREALGLLQDKYTILTVAGGMGFGNVPAVVEDLDKLDDRYQIVVICGSNKELLEKLQQKEYQNPNFKFVGFTTQMELYMDAADVVYTKPGGLSTSETLTKDKLLVMMLPLPGVEEANVAYFTNASLALATNNYFTGSMVISLLMDQFPERIEQIRQARARYVKRHSAKTLGDFILNL